jgi:hypothetical protein
MSDEGASQPRTWLSCRKGRDAPVRCLDRLSHRLQFPPRNRSEAAQYTEKVYAGAYPSSCILLYRNLAMHAISPHILSFRLINLCDLILIIPNLRSIKISKEMFLVPETMLRRATVSRLS